MQGKPLNTTRPKRAPLEGLAATLSEKLVGQDNAIEAIAPYVQLFNAGIAPEGRPVGVFLLLGPTGTGKTRTVEALAEALHGSARHVLRVDCGEFQMEHEVAKLIGAPPGYLGHREKTPMLNQQKLNATASERSPISIVLFDEVEKAAASLTRLLLGVLDKATLKLGDNTAVNFERSLIFLTSNLGARAMVKHLTAGFGFAGMDKRECPIEAGKLESIATHAVRKRFSPEFVNRIDRIITYQPLMAEHLEQILAIQLEELGEHLRRRLEDRVFEFDVSASARSFLIEQGTSLEFGARELKRVVHRHLIQAMADWLVREAVPAGAVMRFDHRRGETELRVSVSTPRRRLDAA